MLISDGGTLVHTRVDEISIVGRNTQCVRLINIGEGEALVGIQRVGEVEGGLVGEGDTVSEEANPEEPIA